MAIVIAFAIVLAFVLIGEIGNSDIYKMAFAAAAGSPQVRQRLGEPIKRGFFVSGNIEESGPSGHADISLPISGPRGNATVYAVAQRSAGLWKFETLQVAFGNGGTRINVLDEQTSGASTH